MSSILMNTDQRKFNEYSVITQWRKKHQLRLFLNDKVNWLKNIGLKFKKIEIEFIEENEDDESLKNFIIEVNEHKSKVLTKHALLAKDKILMSDVSFHLFRNDLHLDLPSLSAVKKERITYRNLFSMSTNTRGCYNNIKDMLVYKIRNSSLKLDNNIMVKFSADGKIISKKVKLINLKFTLINEKDKAKTAKGNYTIGIFRIQNEDYEEITACFENVGNQIDELTDINIDNKIYNIQKYFGGDMKFLAIICGINAANSIYPCIWCKWCKSEKYDAEKIWSITSVKDNARTILEADVFRNENGYIKPPVLKSMPYQNYVIDTLHKFLRITDVLLDYLIIDLQFNYRFSAANNIEIIMKCNQFLQKDNKKFWLRWHDISNNSYGIFFRQYIQKGGITSLINYNGTNSNRMLNIFIERIKTSYKSVSNILSSKSEEFLLSLVNYIYENCEFVVKIIDETDGFDTYSICNSTGMKLN